MPINSWTVLGEFLIIWSKKTWAKPVLQISCNQEGVLAQQIHFQEVWGWSYWQGGSSESSPNQAGLASGDQPRAYSTEQPKKTTKTVEIKLHFVQIDYWGHPGSKLGVWNSCNEETILIRSLSSRAWEQRDLYGILITMQRRSWHYTARAEGIRRISLMGRIVETCLRCAFHCFQDWKRGKNIYFKIIISRTLLSHMLLAEVVNK